MNDSSKQKFMQAVFGEDGTTIDSGTAAALLAATCSGGDPEIGNNIAELLVPEMGDKVDPAMMAALMSACSMINAGATTEDVSIMNPQSIGIVIDPPQWFLLQTVAEICINIKQLT